MTIKSVGTPMMCWNNVVLYVSTLHLESHWQHAWHFLVYANWLSEKSDYLTSLNNICRQGGLYELVIANFHEPEIQKYFFKSANLLGG